MKKTKLFIITLILNSTLLILNCSAQYTKLFDFAGISNGSNPNSTLISDGTFLYGMTNQGGANNLGILFKIMPDGTGYIKLLDFDGTNGSSPAGSLISDGTFLYGMTRYGGTNNLGVIFKIMPDGSGYFKLLDFDGTNGSNPGGSLFSDGTFLYGMTRYGGTNNLGVLFKIMPNGSGYVDVLDFAGAANGSGPLGTLISDGTFLYGTTFQGGTYGYGTLFKIMPDGTGYAQMIDFNGTSYGSYPGSLMFDGYYLYGMTQTGGANDYGVIYKVMTDGTGYIKLLDFSSNSNGIYTTGSLISDGYYLYGMTYVGGTYGAGVLFKVSFDGSGYTKLIDFSGTTNGSTPYGSLILGGGILYGMTSAGGTNNLGTIFKYDPISVWADVVGGDPICSNQCTGSASTSVLNGAPPYTYLWSSGETTPTATGLCAGTNTITVTDNIGGSVSTTVTIASLPQPVAPAICLVTVDDSSTHNIVIWEKPTSTSITNFKIYREDVTNIYTPIGIVPYDSLSEYHDYGADPNITTKRYKLSIVDTCGNESALSPYHNTIYITSSGSGQYNWNLYSIEGAANPVNNYVLYRDNTSTGVWNVVSITAGTQQTLNDPGYASYPNGSWRVETLWNITCTPTRVAVNTTRSNIKHPSITIGINSQAAIDATSIYPNPANDYVSIELMESVQNANIRIMNSIGQIVYEQTVVSSGNSKTIKEIKTTNFEKGIYTIVIETSKAKAFKKLVVN
ncbi:MAG: hypothetical protein A3F72_06365 [Bacteroidetes bacterium RIFCSPLOWO2_12_FULL_35_15]|nr:MAG: hypothetical protein A3F72_06365 [Bacteroidetes bacterium RIFCSPLOWO2_12_FULL_35_15]